jgi:preprotein translocase SecE subunit
MATEAIQASWWQRTITFIRDSYHEVRHRTTWPDVAQVRQASIAIMIFVLVVGLFITLLDITLSAILQKLIPSLFR